MDLPSVRARQKTLRIVPLGLPPGPQPQGRRSKWHIRHTGRCCARRLPRLPIVQLAATASRATLRAVAGAMASPPLTRRPFTRIRRLRADGGGAPTQRRRARSDACSTWASVVGLLQSILVLAECPQDCRHCVERRDAHRWRRARLNGEYGHQPEFGLIPCGGHHAPVMPEEVLSLASCVFRDP